MLNLSTKMTIGDLLDLCGISLEDLTSYCENRLMEGAIDTEGEFIREKDFHPEIIDTFGLGIIPGGKSKSRINTLAKEFEIKLRKYNV